MLVLMDDGNVVGQLKHDSVLPLLLVAATSLQVTAA